MSRNVVRKYFTGFKKSIWFCYIIGALGGSMIGRASSLDESIERINNLIINGSFLIMIPLLYTVISCVSHDIGVSPMMNIVPISEDERRSYIRKYAQVKISIPCLVALICDVMLLSFFDTEDIHTRIYAIIIQIISVIYLTVSDSMVATDMHTSYMNKNVLETMLMYINYFVLIIAIGICISDEISKGEFIVITCLGCGIAIAILLGLRNTWHRNIEKYAITEQL